MIVCCKLHPHLGFDEGLQAEESSIYIKYNLAEYIEEEDDCRENRSTRIYTIEYVQTEKK